jgi:hypothetical protein
VALGGPADTVIRLMAPRLSEVEKFRKIIVESGIPLP